MLSSPCAESLRRVKPSPNTLRVYSETWKSYYIVAVSYVLWKKLFISLKIATKCLSIFTYLERWKLKNKSRIQMLWKVYYAKTTLPKKTSDSPCLTFCFLATVSTLQIILYLVVLVITWAALDKTSTKRRTEWSDTFTISCVTRVDSDMLPREKACETHSYSLRLGSCVGLS